ncbi:MAG TPA: type I-E CRISPR-associated protein Cas7/Cse4/CasC, partial [Clostridia bacterium]|nr:type I-E CRISPR-associated protein Cas7/Cse4/CasC [Clostridia bacterium]
MENKRLYVDIHVLQSMPPSCVNRDDTGSPKTAEYGGVTRARVSSQAWKKAVRAMFLDIFPQERLGTRSKKVLSLLQKELENAGAQEPAALAKTVLSAGIKLKEDQTGALFFISRAQVSALAELALRHQEKPLTDTLKAEALKALKTSPGIDIA